MRIVKVGWRPTQYTTELECRRCESVIEYDVSEFSDYIETISAADLKNVWNGVRWKCPVCGDYETTAYANFPNSWMWLIGSVFAERLQSEFLRRYYEAHTDHTSRKAYTAINRAFWNTCWRKEIEADLRKYIKEKRKHENS